MLSLSNKKEYLIGMKTFSFGKKLKYFQGFRHRWTRSKILEGGVVSFPEGGGGKFFESEGGYPP